jgi:hypothetical protein
MKLIDYDKIVLGLTEKYPDHVFEIKVDATAYPWTPRRVVWIDGNETPIRWPAELIDDIFYASGDEKLPQTEMFCIIDNYVRELLA